jgi:hypothetical protein
MFNWFLESNTLLVLKRIPSSENASTSDADHEIPIVMAVGMYIFINIILLSPINFVYLILQGIQRFN